MLSKNVLSSVCAVTLLACVSASPAVAQTPIDKRVHFTFSGPVSVPGVTLPAGTYQFRIADPNIGRSVVQVRSADGRTLYAQFFTIPSQRPVATEKPAVRFIETRGDVAPAIGSWWYPSERTGWELIYPREQALRIARSAGEPVLTSRATAAALMEANDLMRASGNGEEMSVVQ